MKTQRGFTLVEVIVAIVVLTVGLLGLVTTAALVTRMITRGQRSSVAANFAAQRLEQLRAGGCVNRAGGSEQLVRGGNVVARNSWNWVAAGDSTHRLLLSVQYQSRAGVWRTDTLETAVTCQL
jgi:prepilin-type N-terminal cleavage/methylation domain-containing protein